MGIRDSFKQGFRAGLIEGHNPQVGDVQQGASPPVIQPHMVRIVGEQLRSMCNGCENSQNGLGEGVLAEGGRVAVFSCVKERPGGCAIINGAAASANTNTGVSITPVDVSISGAFGTVVSVSRGK